MPEAGEALPPKGWIRKLEREERVQLVERVGGRSDADLDFVVMMAISATLASLGLLQGATAVVIGAMLVAPLMGPLVAAGLALVQGNLSLFRGSLGVSALGIAIGFAVSAALGLANPGYEPSLEIEARGRPDLLDLGIAFASGMVAAYASSRPKVVDTLAGVAIAAALVPPLAVVGIALTNGHLGIAGNATILLTTNLVAIVLGAAGVFWLFGVQTTLQGSRLPAWARMATWGLVCAGVALIAPLLSKQLETYREGQARPLTYPVAPHVREAVYDYVAAWPGVEVVMLGRISVEPENGVTAVLGSRKPVAPLFEEGLREAVHEARGDDSPVRVFTMLLAGGLPETANPSEAAEPHP